MNSPPQTKTGRSGVSHQGGEDNCPSPHWLMHYSGKVTAQSLMKWTGHSAIELAGKYRRLYPRKCQRSLTGSFLRPGYIGQRDHVELEGPMVPQSSRFCKKLEVNCQQVQSANLTIRLSSITDAGSAASTSGICAIASCQLVLRLFYPVRAYSSAPRSRVWKDVPGPLGVPVARSGEEPQRIHDVGAPFRASSFATARMLERDVELI
jgi:hypothetical protein